MVDDGELIPTGARAPDALLHDATGAEVALSNFWSDRPALVFFLRHFGCSLCREHLQRICAAYPEIRARAGAVVVVTFAAPNGAARFGRLNGLPFPVLADPTRRAYRAFGLTEGHIAEAVDPAALLRQAALVLRGHVPYVTSYNAIGQRGGVFVVDRAGIVRFAHAAVPIYNYPAVEQYVSIFDALACVEHSVVQSE